MSKIVIVHPNKLAKDAKGAIESVKLKLPCPNADVAVYAQAKFDELGLGQAQNVQKFGIGYIVVVALSIEEGIGWANELRKATELPVVPVVLYQIEPITGTEADQLGIFPWNIRWIVYEDHPFIPADKRSAAEARLAKLPSLEEMNGRKNTGTGLPAEFMWHTRTEKPWLAYSCDLPKVNKRVPTPAERANIAGQTMKVVASKPVQQQEAEKPKPNRKRKRKSAFVPAE